MDCQVLGTEPNSQATKTLSRLDARIPRWDLDDLRARKCPFCAEGGTPRFTRPDGLSVCACETCSCYFVSPAPSSAQIEAFYRDYSRNHCRASIGSRRLLRGQILKSRPHDDLRLRELSSLIDLRERRVLDVGCGMGQTLVRLEKLGARALGVDLDEDAVAFVRDELCIRNVWNGEIAALPRNLLCDVIILNDVIEHPLDCLTLLVNASKRLERNGLISLWTPNATHLEEEEDPIALRVDLEHMQYLSTRTCLWIAGQFGLEVVHLETLGFPGLHGIEHVRQGRLASSLRTHIKGTLKLLPGVSLAKRMREALARDLRLGRYHLFCILKRSD